MAIEITEASYNKEVEEHNGTALVDFWAPWCGPCRMIAPVVEELSKDYAGKAKICKVNVDENGQIAAKFGIASIPTILIFKNGKVVSKVVGVVSKAELAKRLDAALI